LIAIGRKTLVSFTGLTHSSAKWHEHRLLRQHRAK
jgi:hypothetical protein